MATLIWTGAIDGDITDAGNFLDASTLATPGSALANSDTLICDRGDVDIDAASPGLTGINLIGLPGYAGRVAPSGSLGIACASVRWTAGYLSLAGNITAGNIRCRRGQKFNYASGTATDLWVGCDTDIGAAAIVTDLRASGSIQVTALANGTGFTLAKMLKGSRLISRRAGVFDVGQGSMVETRDAAAMTTGTIIRDGGMLLVSASTGSAGTVEIEAGGLLDCSNSNASITIATLARWEGARANLFTQAGAVTITNPVVIYGLTDTANYAVASPLPL